MWLNNIILTQDDLNNLDWVTGSVSGVDSGMYEVFMDGVKILDRYLTNGFDTWTYPDVPGGTHTFCATKDPTNSVCKTIFIQSPLPKKYGCADGCTTPTAAGTYNTQAECTAGCPKPDKYECQNGSCVKSWNGFATLAECQAACNTGSPNGLSVNGKQGSVTVPLNTPVTLRIAGLDPGKDVSIVNITDLPDTTLAKGTTDASGTFTTTATFSKKATFEIRGYYNCLSIFCVSETNTVTVIVSDEPTTTTGLSVNGKQGSVTVPLNTPVTIKISGIGADKSITLTNVSTTPDTNLSEGVTDSAGNYTTTLTFSKNEVLELRGYYNCLFSVCTNETNTVTVTAGEDTSIDYLKWALIIIILIVIAYYSKELGIFKAIKKR